MIASFLCLNKAIFFICQQRLLFLIDTREKLSYISVEQNQVHMNAVIRSNSSLLLSVRIPVQVATSFRRNPSHDSDPFRHSNKNVVQIRISTCYLHNFEILLHHDYSRYIRRVDTFCGGIFRCHYFGSSAIRQNDAGPNDVPR